MKRFIRSLAKSLRAGQGAAAVAAAARATTRVPVMTENLESRMLMAADLSGGMLTKFGNPGAATSGPYAPGIVTAAGDGANGESSTTGGDDTLATAKRKSLNFTADGNISHGLDVDMYKFDARSGQHITFDIDRPQGSTLDSVLRLFNSAGQELAQSDDDPSPTEANSLESFIDFTFSTSGTYFIAVSGSFNVGFNAITGAGDVMSPSTGRYQLVAQRYVNPDNNDSISNAGAEIGKNDSETHEISTPTDVDLYKIKVKAGDRISFDIDLDLNNPLDPLDSILRLFDDNGVQLAINDDGDDPTEPASNVGHSYFEFTFLEDGNYFIGVSGASNDAYNINTGAGDVPGATGHYTLYTTKLN